MTVHIKLDASAIAALFSTPEAKLELQQGVIAEICRRLFDKYVTTEVRNLIEAEFATQKNALVEAVKSDATFRKHFTDLFEKEIANVQRSWGGTTYQLKPELKDKILVAVQDSVAVLLKEYALKGDQLIQAAADAAFLRVQEKALANIDARILRKTNDITNAEIDRRVEEAMTAALKAVKS